MCLITTHVASAQKPGARAARSVFTGFAGNARTFYETRRGDDDAPLIITRVRVEYANFDYYTHRRALLFALSYAPRNI